MIKDMIEFFTIHNSLTVFVEFNMHFDAKNFYRMLENAFKEEKIIEFYDQNNDLYMIRTSDFIGYKVKNIEGDK